jgi:hypothetical protein
VALAGFYRASGWSVGERLAALIAERRNELASLPGQLVQIHASRVGRVAAGAVGVLMGLGMFLSAAHEGIREENYSTLILILAWVAMLVAYTLFVLNAPALLRHRLRGAFRMSGKPHHDLARLEELGDSTLAARRIVTALERWSIALPLMAVSLLAPLTLHLAFCAVVGWPDSESFSLWIGLSGMIVGHAHLFLAAASARFAWKLSRSQPHELVRYGWGIYGLTVAVSAVPGIVFLALPPALTALTGLCFVPLMFGWARRTVSRERELLALG